MFLKRKNSDNRKTIRSQHNEISLNLLFCYYVSTILLIIWKSNLNTIKSTSQQTNWPIEEKHSLGLVFSFSVGIAQWEWLWDCFSYFLLSGLWCQHLWGSSEDRYISKRLSKMLFVCYRLLNSRKISINISEKMLVTYLLGHLWRSKKGSGSCTKKGAITGPWWVSSTMKVR